MPPKTTAAIAYISKLDPVVAGSEEAFIAIQKKEASPTMPPAIMKTSIFTRPTLIPDINALFALLPMA